MSMTGLDIHALIGHPVIDSDGHLLEPTVLLREHLTSLVGGSMARRILLSAGRQQSAGNGNPAAMQPRTGSWLTPSRARDIATAMAPALRAERAEELGIDFSILYPSIGLVLAALPDADFRLPGVRAVNTMTAQLCLGHRQRLVPAALIPMHTPEEAVAELEYARNQLGFQVAVIPPLVMRPVPALESSFPRLSRLDSYGIDSAYDYDPVWAKFAELGLAVTSHGGVSNCLPFGWDSPSNYVYNHISAHSFQQEHLCKSIVLGGVPMRFPDLNFAFLECGALWAAGLLQALLDHYHKRGPDGLARLDPARTDRAELERLLHDYGGADFAASIPLASGQPHGEDAVPIQDFARAELDSAADITRMFDRFYFGCEADDRSVAVASRAAELFGAPIKTVLGSDIGHWDVTDAAGVLPESYELVESSSLDLAGFRDFSFTNTVLLHGGMNAEFFAGTAVQDRAADVLRQIPVHGPVAPR